MYNNFSCKFESHFFNWKCKITKCNSSFRFSVKLSENAWYLLHLLNTHLIKLSKVFYYFCVLFIAYWFKYLRSFNKLNLLSWSQCLRVNNSFKISRLWFIIILWIALLPLNRFLLNLLYCYRFLHWIKFLSFIYSCWYWVDLYLRQKLV